MKSNVKSVRSLPDYDETVYFYDKHGNRCTKKVKVTNRFLVTMNNGSSTVLTADEIKNSSIICELPKLQNETTIQTTTATVVNTPTQNTNN